MDKDVQGWCLSRDSQGVPTLSECALMKGVEGRYFAVMSGSQGNPITVRSYQRGETFFINKMNALEELREQLATELNKHQMRVVYLGRKLDAAKIELEAEEEAEDAGRG